MRTDAKIKLLEARIGNLIVRSGTPEIKKRFEGMMVRLQELKSRKERMRERKDSRKVLLSESIHEKKLLIWRDLSIQEKKVDFKLLNEAFNETEDDLKDELTTAVQEDLSRALIRIQNRLKAGDIAGIAAISFIGMGKIYSIINKYAKASYEQGKSSAAKELKVGQPVTPTVKTQLTNLDSDMIAEAFVTDIDLAAKQKAKEGLAKGIATAAVVGAIAKTVADRSSRMITNTVGNLVGENLNKGRRLVFEANITRIKAFQRSEILDGRTCNMCLSLDSRVISADDPMTQLDEVHDRCRGIWVPVLTEEKLPGPEGFPKSVLDAFDTIGGTPTVNAFTQLKKPINKGNEAVQAEIQKRLKK